MLTPQPQTERESRSEISKCIVSLQNNPFLFLETVLCDSVTCAVNCEQGAAVKADCLDARAGSDTRYESPVVFFPTCGRSLPHYLASGSLSVTGK